ncbi:MAG: alpha/beta hydrolase [Lentisphaeria bacterium]|nr:alpha/beta hydrolase [Lentisphaeria bacterium]
MRINLRNNLAGNAPGDDFQPYLDTFLLPGCSTPLGGVLIVPGGGYAIRGDYEGDAVAAKFNSLGYHAFVLQYRVSPNRFPAPQQDLVRAVKIIRANAEAWRLNKLAVLGFSAGAHLAASGAMLSEKFAVNEGDEADKFPGTVDALVLCYPVISLTASFAHGSSGENLFGPETPAEVKARLNMNELVDASTPPSFLWHTADDDAVSVYNSLEFAQKMWQCGNSCELHVFPHGYHGRGLGYGTADLKQWTDLCAVFLETSAGFTRG